MPQRAEVRGVPLPKRAEVRGVPLSPRVDLSGVLLRYGWLADAATAGLGTWMFENGLAWSLSVLVKESRDPVVELQTFIPKIDQS